MEYLAWSFGGHNDLLQPTYGYAYDFLIFHYSLAKVCSLTRLIPRKLPETINCNSHQHKRD